MFSPSGRAGRGVYHAELSFRQPAIIGCLVKSGTSTKRSEARLRPRSMEEAMAKHVWERRVTEAAEKEWWEYYRMGIELELGHRTATIFAGYVLKSLAQKSHRSLRELVDGMKRSNHRYLRGRNVANYEILARAMLGEAEEIDWRPTETIPEDYYAV